MNSEEIHDLQVRLSFQEDLLQALNLRVADQEKELSSLRIQLQHVSKKLRVLADNAGDSIDVPDGPPPHY